MSVFIRNDLKRIGQVQEDYSLFLCFLDLDHICRHLIFCSSVNIINLVSAKTYCCTAGIHSGITATYNGNVFAKVNIFIADNFSEEINTADYTLGILALAADTGRYPCTDTNAYSIKISADRFKRDVLADLCICNHGYAHFFKNSDFLIQNFFRKTVFRNTIAEHTAKLWHCLVDRHIMTKLTEEICHGKSVRTAADHSNVLSCVRLALRNKRIFTELVSICCKSLKVCNSDRLVYHTAAACCLTRMRTDTTDRSRKRNVFSDQFDGLFILSVCDQTYIALTVCTCRTCKHTWWTAVTLMVGKKKLQVCFS